MSWSPSFYSPRTLIVAISMNTDKIFKLADVATHNTREDLWMVISGKVYDVTKFVDEHPGGEEVLTDCAGQDATTEFNDVGHSEDAVDMLKDMLVGTLEPEETVKTKKPTIDTKVAQESSSSSPVLVFAIAATVAALAFVYLQLSK